MRNEALHSRAARETAAVRQKKRWTLDDINELTDIIFLLKQELHQSEWTYYTLQREHDRLLAENQFMCKLFDIKEEERQ